MLWRIFLMEQHKKNLPLFPRGVFSSYYPSFLLMGRCKAGTDLTARCEWNVTK